MTQSAKFIDITKSFLPIDPGTLPPALHIGKGEAEPETKMAVTAYEGYNFLPTGHGYKSYFGTDIPFNIPAMPVGVNVDRIFIVNSSVYTSYFVALTDSGIYTNTGAGNTAWVQSVVLATIVPPLKEEWSVALIGNSIYMYRAKEAAYYRLDSAVPNVFVAVVPTFLNMAGQRGLFKAGGRLGFWDSLQSISWSNLDDLGDFVPSLETLAGNVLFKEITGNIVNILPYGENFIVYATHSIVLIEKDATQSSQWNPYVILANAGPAYSEQVCSASPDTMHFVYTSIGLYKIEARKATMIVPEVFDLLKESLNPVMIQFLENRYLCMKIIEAKFIEGLVELNAISYGLKEFPTGVSITATSSYSADEILAMLSKGLFVEQQAQARNVLIDNNILDASDALLVPIWSTVSKTRINNAYPAIGIDFFGSIGFTDVGTITTSVQVTSATGNESSAYTPSLVMNGINKFLHTYTNQGIFYNGYGLAFTNSASRSGATALHDLITEVKTIFDTNDNYVDNFFYDFPVNIAGTTTMRIPLNSNIADGAFSNLSGGFAGTYNGKVGIYADSIAVADSSYFYKAQCLMTTRRERIDYKYSANRLQLQAITTKAAIRKLKVQAGYTNFQDDGVQNRTPSISIGQDLPIMVSDMLITAWKYTRNNGTEGQVIEPNNTFAGLIPLVPITYPIQYGSVVTDPWLIDLLDANEVSVQLQAGSPGPVYPTYAGLWVYDTAYKKWGKANGAFKTLIDLSAINTFQGPLVTTRRFGINAGILKTNGLIYRYNQKPAASYIKYGKIGYARLGFTSLEEVKVQFRIPSTGTIEIAGSFDGKNPEQALVITQSYVNKTSLTVFPSMPARWHTIKFTGQFDLSYLEYRGFIQGKR